MPVIARFYGITIKMYFYVLFLNNAIKKYDVTPMLEEKRLHKLKNRSDLKTASVDSGGYGISWHDDCDPSENELRTKAVYVTDKQELDKLHFLFP